MRCAEQLSSSHAGRSQHGFEEGERRSEVDRSTGEGRGGRFKLKSTTGHLVRVRIFGPPPLSRIGHPPVSAEPTPAGHRAFQTPGARSSTDYVECSRKLVVEEVSGPAGWRCSRTATRSGCSNELVASTSGPLTSEMRISSITFAGAEVDRRRVTVIAVAVDDPIVSSRPAFVTRQRPRRRRETARGRRYGVRGRTSDPRAQAAGRPGPATWTSSADLPHVLGVERSG